MAPQVSKVLRAVRAQQVVRRQSLPALLLAHADESELPLAPSLRAQQASQLEAPPPAQQQRPRALPPRWASPRARREPPAHSVSPRQAQRSLAEGPLALQASSAPLSQPPPSFLFPLWQPLLLALHLPRLPES